MSETAIPVDEAAKDFLRLLDLVEHKHEPAILVPEGQPVATLSPLPNAALTCAELADRWPKLDKLSPDEANAFADDLEDHRELNQAIERQAAKPLVPWAKAKKELGLA